MATTDAVQIPGKAVSEGGTDVGPPTRTLLEELNLLGTPRDTEDAAGPGAVITGPPQSVALIEAGATAATKWWASGLGALVIAAWGSVAGWWPEQDTSVKVAVLAGAAVVTGVAVAGIAYLIGSDVRGRAIAAVAVIEARAKVATAMLEAAEAAYTPAPAESAVEIIPLPAVVHAKKLEGADTDGWRAIAMERQPDGTIKYILVKGSEEERVPASGLEFHSV